MALSAAPTYTKTRVNAFINTAVRTLRKGWASIISIDIDLFFSRKHFEAYHKNCHSKPGHLDVGLHCFMAYEMRQSPVQNNAENLGPGPEVIKLFPSSTQMSMKLFLLINVKMPTIVGILTFVSRKNSILGLSELEKCRIS